MSKRWLDERILLIECGVAETRAALLVRGEPICFFFGPARGDEHLPRPAQSGEIYLGRVKNHSRPLRGAFVDIGEEREGFLNVNSAQKFPTEGQSVIVRVSRPAIGWKGALLTREWPKGCSADARAVIEQKSAKAAAPVRLDTPTDVVLEALSIAGQDEVTEVNIDDVAAKNILLSELSNREKTIPINLADRPLDLVGADDWLVSAFEHIVQIPGGGRMIFDETEAMTVVDVDSGGMVAGATGRLNDKVNLASAKLLFSELSRRQIGGRIIVDFLPPSDSKARGVLLDALKSSQKNRFMSRFGKLGVDGVFDLTAPRRELSLLERATERAGHGWLRTGRRLTLDWEAKTAVAALERRLAIARSTRVRMTVSLALSAYLDTRPQWQERLAARFGARFEITHDQNLEGRRFAIVEN